MNNFNFKDILTSPETVVSKSLNYGIGDLGKRSPYNPVGYVIRESGSIEIFAGISKAIFDIKGNSTFLGNEAKFLTNKVNFRVKNLEDISFGDFTFNPSSSNLLFLYKKQDLNKLRVLTDKSYVDLQTGVIQNTTKLTDYLGENAILKNKKQLQSLLDYIDKVI